jgi:hypothetical protein
MKQKKGFIRGQLLPDTDVLSFPKTTQQEWYTQLFTPEEIQQELELLSLTNPQQADLLFALADYRFFTVRDRKKDIICDRFLKFWVDLIYFDGTITSPFLGMFVARREIRKTLDNILHTYYIDTIQHMRMLYEQLYNGARRYIKSCRTDRNYSHYMFGFVEIKDKQLKEKMLAEFIDAGIGFPYRSGCLIHHPEIAWAAYDAWLDEVPETEELIKQRLITTFGEDKGLQLNTFLSERENSN